MGHCYTPINGLPQEGGGGVCANLENLTRVKRTRVRILTSLKPPEKWDSAVILQKGEDQGMTDLKTFEKGRKILA